MPLRTAGAAYYKAKARGKLYPHVSGVAMNPVTTRTVVETTKLSTDQTLWHVELHLVLRLELLLQEEPVEAVERKFEVR